MACFIKQHGRTNIELEGDYFNSPGQNSGTLISDEVSYTAIPLTTVITCRAAVTWEKGAPLKIESVQVQVPAANEIRIKMVATGLCVSDLNYMNGFYPGMDLPGIVGHEGVGHIESVGSEVTGFSPGDAVIPLWSFQCNECRWCKSGRRNICMTAMSFGNGRRPDGTTRITCNGKELTQASGLGLYSEYILVNQLSAVKIQCQGPLENLAPYGCAIPTGYGSALYTAKVFKGAVCAVWGLGAIGLATVLGCRDAGASRIIGINRSKEKFHLGKLFGCTDCISPNDYKDPISKVLKGMTNGLGVDFVFVCVGDPKVMEDAFEGCCNGIGECIISGVHLPQPKMTVNHVDAVFGKTLKGTWFGDCLTENLVKIVGDYYKGTLPTDHLITRTLPLERINEGIEALKTGKIIRTVIKF